MLTEEWTHWSPLEKALNNFYINFIWDTPLSLKIVLTLDDFFEKNVEKPRQKKLCVAFQQPVIFYKHVDEHCSIKDTLDLRIKYGDSFIWDSTFFKVTNSKYLQWLKEESCKNNTDAKLIHFVLLENESRTDIITTQEPLVEWVENAD